MQHIKLRSTDTTNIDEIDDIFKSEEVKKPAKKMSKAMMMYLQRAKEHGMIIIPIFFINNILYNSLIILIFYIKDIV